MGCNLEHFPDEFNENNLVDYAPGGSVKLLLDVNDLELADLLLALEGYGLQVAADDVPRVAALRNRVRVAAGLEPEPVWGEDQT